jgi:hypothetical protein
MFLAWVMHFLLWLTANDRGIPIDGAEAGPRHPPIVRIIAVAYGMVMREGLLGFAELLGDDAVALDGDLQFIKVRGTPLILDFRRGLLDGGPPQIIVSRPYIRPVSKGRQYLQGLWRIYRIRYRLGTGLQLDERSMVYIEDELAVLYYRTDCSLAMLSDISPGKLFPVLSLICPCNEETDKFRKRSPMPTRFTFLWLTHLTALAFSQAKDMSYLDIWVKAKP